MYKNRKVLAFAILLFFGIGAIQQSLIYSLNHNATKKNTTVALLNQSNSNKWGKESNIPFIISESIQNIFTNVTIENTLQLTKTATILLKNVTAETIILKEESQAYIYNSTITNLKVYDAANVVIENSLIKGNLAVSGLTHITMTNCTVFGTVGLNEYTTATIKDSNLTTVEDYNTLTIKIYNTSIGLYYTTTDQDEIPMNTYIVNSTIDYVQVDSPDLEYFTVPKTTIETSNITEYNGMAIYQGPGEMSNNATVSGTLEYMFSMDQYTIDSIVNFTPMYMIFYGVWTINNSVFPAEIDKVGFIDANITLNQVVFDTYAATYESTLNIYNSAVNFSSVNFFASEFHTQNAKVMGSIWLSESIATAENSELEEVLSYSSSNTTLINTTLTHLKHHPAGYNGFTSLNNVTMETIDIDYDSVDLTNVNVTTKMSVNVYLQLSNFTNVNTTLLSIKTEIYDDANLTETGFQLLPTDTRSFIEVPNVTYTVYQIAQIFVYSGATLRISNVTNIAYPVYVSGSTLIVENSSFTTGGKISVSSSTLYIYKSDIQVSYQFYFNIYYGDTTIVNSTVRWFSAHQANMNIINSTITASPIIYDSSVNVENSTLSTDSGSTFTAYNSRLNFTNVVFDYNLRTSMIYFSGNILAATYFNNVTIGGTYTEIVFVNGTSNAVFSNTGFSGTYYNATRQAVSTTFNSKKYYIRVFDNGTLKFFNVSSSDTTAIERLYGYNNATIILENATLSTGMTVYDFTNVFLNNSQMNNYENIWLYGNSTLQNERNFSSTFYGIYARDNSRVLLENATVTSTIRAYDSSFINLTNILFSGFSSLSVVFYDYSSGVIKSDVLNPASVVSIADNSYSSNIRVENQKINTFTISKFTNITVTDSIINVYSSNGALTTTNTTELLPMRPTIINSNITTFNNLKRLLTNQSTLNNSGLFSESSVILGTNLINTNVTNFAYNATYTLENGTLDGYNATAFAVYLYTGSVSPIPTVYALSSEIVMEEGAKQSITWKLRDYKPNRYYIYENDTQILYGYYQQMTTITLDLSTYTTGFYNFTILANNGYGNSNTSTVFVTITSPEAPQIISKAANVTYESGLSVTLSWTATDISPSDYKVYVNGTKKAIDSWTNGTPVTYILNETTEGIYNVTISFWDKVGNHNSSSAFVTVLPAQAPVVTFLNSTTQITRYDNETVVLAWKAEDASPNQYTIYVNGTNVTSDTWENQETIAYSFSGTAGTYNITISFSDKIGLSTTHTVIITLQSSGGEQQPPADYTWIIILVVISVAVIVVVFIYLVKVKKVSV